MKRDNRMIEQNRWKINKKKTEKLCASSKNSYKQILYMYTVERWKLDVISRCHSPNMLPFSLCFFSTSVNNTRQIENGETHRDDNEQFYEDINLSE